MIHDLIFYSLVAAVCSVCFVFVFRTVILTGFKQAVREVLDEQKQGGRTK